MRLFLPWVVFGAACTSMGEPVVDRTMLDVAPGSTNDGGLRGGLVTLAVDRLLPGGAYGLTVGGAAPGELVHVARSTTGLGAGPCLGTMGGLCVDLDLPSLHASGYADDVGTWHYEGEIPAGVAIGTDLAFQAIIPRGGTGLSWLKSEVVETIVGDATRPFAELAVGEIVITEVMASPSVGANGDWFEIHNLSGVDINIGGMRVVGATGEFTLPGPAFVDPDQYVVFGASRDPGRNGGATVHIEWPDRFTLPGTWGEVHLMRDDEVLDAVAWDDGASWPLAEGASMVHDGADPEANDRGDAWCTATDVFGDGDLGTPGGGLGCTPPYEPLDNEVSWEGFFYAAIDDTPVDAGYAEFGTCQTDPLPIPEGWELAPNIGGIDSFVNSHGWSTHCMITSDGESWGTFNYGLGGCGGGTLGIDGDTYYANSCSRRVLIRRPG